MAEKDMAKAVNAALATHGIDDTVEAVGQLQPRGTSGAMFAGGLVGGEIGGAFGDVGQAIGVGAGALGAPGKNVFARFTAAGSIFSHSLKSSFAFGNGQARK